MYLLGCVLLAFIVGMLMGLLVPQPISALIAFLAGVTLGAIGFLLERNYGFLKEL